MRENKCSERVDNSENHKICTLDYLSKSNLLASKTSLIVIFYQSNFIEINFVNIFAAEPTMASTLSFRPAGDSGDEYSDDDLYFGDDNDYSAADVNFISDSSCKKSNFGKV